ncbi:MAG: HAMP domain-containing sensor histidine kinase [Myxococcota bacterium]
MIDTWLALGTPTLTVGLVAGAVASSLGGRPIDTIAWVALALVVVVTARSHRGGIRRAGWLAAASAGFVFAVLTASTPVALSVLFLGAPWLAVGAVALVDPAAFRLSGVGLVTLAVTTLWLRHSFAPIPEVDVRVELVAASVAFAVTLGGLHALGAAAYRSAIAQQERTTRLRRTLTIVERQLEESQARAIAAHEATDRLLAAVSHELRTPLNAVRGYAEIVLEELEDTELVSVQHDLRRIHLAASQLLEGIGGMIELSAIDPHARELEVAPVDVAGVITDAVGIVFQRLERNGNSLKLDGPSERQRFCTDLHRLRHLVVDLLANAASLVSNGVVSVHWRIEDHHLELAVAHVPGISSNVPDSPTPIRMELPEAALAECRRMAEALEGTLNVDSIPSETTGVRVRLPDLDRPLAAAG